MIKTSMIPRLVLRQGRENGSTTRRLGLLLGAAALAGIGIWFVSAGDEPEPAPNSTCQQQLEFEDVRYVAIEVRNLPPLPQPIGRGRLLECTSTGRKSVGLYSVVGIPSSDVVRTESTLWVSAELPALPEALARLRKQVACTRDVTALAVMASTNAQVERDYEPTGPYSAELVVQGGQPPYDEFSSMRVRVGMGDTTEGAFDPSIIEPALSMGRPLRVDLRCRPDGAWTASSIALD